MTESAESLLSRFDVTKTEVAIDEETFSIIHPRDPESLIDEAAFNHDERLPYWADVWPSSIALALAVRSMNGAGLTFLELGCGAGLVATVAQRSGFDVTASDYYDDALAFTRLNALNNTGRAPKVMLLDWRELPNAIPAFDIVVGADVLYERAVRKILGQKPLSCLSIRSSRLVRVSSSKAAADSALRMMLTKLP